MAPKFDENGLIPVITTDFNGGGILMHGYMNAESLKKTIETKEAHYWSRSRKKIWRKGEVSGFIQKVKDNKEIEMKFTEKGKIFDPKKVYKDEPNPTKL